MNLLILLATVEVLFVVSTFVANFRSWIGPDPYALFVLISTNLAFVLVWTGIKLTISDHSAGARFAHITSELRDIATSRPRVEALVDHDFYHRFGKAMRDASTGVAITHLDTSPPNRNKNTPAADYYAAALKTIKANARTNFRRVERASSEKRDWLEHLMKEYEGVGNFSLGVLLLPSRSRRTGLVSVQLVDESDVVLVAVAEHDSSLGVRDIWITHHPSADLWRRYYEDILWRPAARVIENGHLNQAEWKRVTDFIEAQ